MKIDNAQFKTAQENMDYDETLLELKERRGICRLYQWQNQPSITLPYNRTLPTELIDIDHAHRPTGGGIVFHSPGDLLFTIIASMKDPIFPTTFKEKLQWIPKIDVKKGVKKLADWAVKNKNLFLQAEIVNNST